MLLNKAQLSIVMCRYLLLLIILPFTAECYGIIYTHYPACIIHTISEYVTLLYLEVISSPRLAVHYTTVMGFFFSLRHINTTIARVFYCVVGLWQEACQLAALNK